jgi:hypothetical protein
MSPFRKHPEYYVIIKFKVHPTTGHEGPEREYVYSSTLALTSALNGVGGQRHGPDALSPGKTSTHCNYVMVMVMMIIIIIIIYFLKFI